MATVFSCFTSSYWLKAGFSSTFAPSIINIKGYENWEMDEQMHEGLFHSDFNELRAAFEATVDNVSVIMVFRAYKQ